MTSELTLMAFNFRLHFRPTLFLIPVLILSACAPAAPVGDIDLPRRGSPTATESPAAAQSTTPQAQPGSGLVPFPARLAVRTARARVLTPEGFEAEVGQAQSLDIQLNDGIEVIKLDGQSQQSYSILHFPDFLNVELLGNTKVFLTEVKQDAEGSTEVTLDLDGGHMFLHLNEERSTRVTIRTPYTTIRTLTSGAEFDICRDAVLTCVVVKAGVVEITAENRREIVKAGEAGLVLKDQPPSPATCAPAPVFTAWEERYRQFADAPALQQQIARLPEKPCPLTEDGLPLHARILYRDEFGGQSSGWDQGESDQFTARYVRSSGPRYYQVQVRGAEERYLAFVPNGSSYEDVNIDLRAFTEAAGSGAFRYGVVFRRSGDQYYAFAISPSTAIWYVLKSSSAGLEVLKEGIDRRMRGLEAQDTLRVETYGSTFLVFINGRFIDWVSDPDYASGEVGLFVETLDNPDALIGFNSITIWDLPAPALIPDRGENCFNAIDDDADGQIDQADPDCQRPDPSVASPPPSLPLPTNTPGPASTLEGPPSATPALPTQPPLPTLPLPTVPLPTIDLPLPTIELPLPIVPPVGTPTPE